MVVRNCRGRIDSCGAELIKTWCVLEGLPIKEVARRLNCTPRAVRICIARNFGNAGHKPPVRSYASIHKRRVIVKKLALLRSSGHCKRRFPSCRAIARYASAETLFTVSSSTVRRDLIALGLRAKRRPRGPQRLPGDEGRRLNFCRTHRNVKDILFSDEKIFDINDHGCLFQWCSPHEQPQRRQFGGYVAKVHVWGVIGEDVKELVVLPPRMINTDVYIRHCLSPVLVPLVQAHGHKHIFMQDGAKPHTSNRTLAYLNRKGVRVLSNWPPRSPDLNPIENLWALVQRKVSDCGPLGAEQLKHFVVQCWNDIPQDTVDRLVRSFSRRCVSCISNKGF